MPVLNETVFGNGIFCWSTSPKTLTEVTAPQWHLLAAKKWKKKVSAFMGNGPGRWGEKRSSCVIGERIWENNVSVFLVMASSSSKLIKGEQWTGQMCNVEPYCKQEDMSTCYNSAFQIFQKWFEQKKRKENPQKNIFKNHVFKLLSGYV